MLWQDLPKCLTGCSFCGKNVSWFPFFTNVKFLSRKARRRMQRLLAEEGVIGKNLTFFQLLFVPPTRSFWPLPCLSKISGPRSPPEPLKAVQALTLIQIPVKVEKSVLLPSDFSLLSLSVRWFKNANARCTLKRKFVWSRIVILSRWAKKARRNILPLWKILP